MNEKVKKKIALHSSQKEIATHFETSQQTISRWINGSFPAEQVIPMCEFLNWKVLPHELRQDLHPTPTSGIPDGVTLPEKREGV
ncbi:YdaS family helix-turn-helix protein [Enterobacter asburiae]|uniref:transcriptional regulator n=1 Tax=Enterobacter asburiae TaxID=61645 RepID=UPI002FFC982F